MMIPSPFLSATVSKRSALTTSTVGSSAKTQSRRNNLSACDIISVRVRRRRSSSGNKTVSSCTIAPPKPLMLLFVAIASFFFANKVAPVHSLSAAKNQWINKSVQYYNGITRGSEHVQQSPTYLKSAMENYFAIEKIRNNKPQHAEYIFRRLMKEVHPNDSKHDDEHHCAFSELAVPTLLLGLLLQREERFEETRTVFQGFADAVDGASEGERMECSCCARVLQAYALFEMKQDNPMKATELILKSIRMDRNTRTVLRWKMFRDSLADYRRIQREERRSRKNRAPLAVAEG